MNLNRKRKKKQLSNLYRFYINIFNNQKLRQYKFMQSRVIKDLTHSDFSICLEIHKLSRLKYDIIEIPINYVGRTYSEGKKLDLKMQ